MVWERKTRITRGRELGQSVSKSFTVSSVRERKQLQTVSQQLICQRSGMALSPKVLHFFFKYVGFDP